MPADLKRVLRAEADLARLRSRRLPVRHDEGAARLRQARRRQGPQARRRPQEGHRPRQAPSARCMVNPGGPGGSAIDYLQQVRRRRLPGAGPRPLRHGRHRPARRRPQRARRVPDGQADGRVHPDRPDPRRRSRRPVNSSAPSRSSRRAARSAPASCSAMSPPSRRPATWTSCAPSSATRS